MGKFRNVRFDCGLGKISQGVKVQRKGLMNRLPEFKLWLRVVQG